MDVYKKIENFCKNYIGCNHFILFDRARKAVPHTVNLNWWKLGGEHQNIGDALSPIVTEWMKKYYNIDMDYTKKIRHLYAIGSIINSGYQNATIWGSGILEDRLFWWRFIRKLDIRCVRGPVTRDILLKNGYQCPKIYGDPAVLMPMIYMPECKKQYRYTVIHHHNVFKQENVNSISPLVKEYKYFIDRIVQSDLVISSSLHGIILAETYGVPAIFLHEGNLNLTKYIDWYSSTGRKEFKMAKTVDEALGLPIPEIPDFSEMRNNLIHSFPKDLWERK